MNIIPKITARISPPTTQLAYLGKQPVDLLFSVLTFADGSLRVKVDNPEVVTKQSTLFVDAYLQNLNDLMIVAQLQEIVDRLTDSIFTSLLTITSPVYSRYDRVMFEDGSDGFGSKTFAAFVKAANYDIVRYLDCHSDVLVSQTYPAHDIYQKHLLDLTAEATGLQRSIPTIAPDKGAVKKNTNPDLVFDKVRDVTNGKITGMSIVHAVPKDSRVKDYLVVDDLCEGGRTFLELADVFKRDYDSIARLHLYVTHGLFTNNAIPKLLEKYSNIYVYIMKQSTYDALTDQQKQRVHVVTLVEAI